MKPRVFSGVQPSGDLHIGNYLGAIRRWVHQQDDRENIFCIVDLHAITVPQDPAVLRHKTRELAAIYLAAGLDPERSTIFVQSHIPAHSELTWLLNCVTPMGWLRRMTQFKEKSARQKEIVSAGLFDYPVLMAADILLYQTNIVPVGDDQRQHVELSRDIAIRFNTVYGPTFTIPEAEIPEVGARIMSLDDPTRKMAKSESGPGTIALLDPPDVIRSKVARARTDAFRDIVFDPSREGIFNLLTIYELLSGESRSDIEDRFVGKGYAEFKRELGDLVVDSLQPLQESHQRLMSDVAMLDGILSAAVERIAPIAEETLSTAKARLGVG